jgi:hypothetical protein
MKTEVVLCDCRDEGQTKCQGFAVGACVICGQDFCKDHVGRQLAIWVGVDRSSAHKDIGTLCTRCVTLFSGDGSNEADFEEVVDLLEAPLAKMLEVLKIIWARQALEGKKDNAQRWPQVPLIERLRSARK